MERRDLRSAIQHGIPFRVSYRAHWQLLLLNESQFGRLAGEVKTTRGVAGMDAVPETKSSRPVDSRGPTQGKGRSGNQATAADSFATSNPKQGQGAN